MKIFRASAAFGAAFALVLLGALASRATLPLPGVQGPFLGDQSTNLFTVAQAINLNNQNGFATLAAPNANVQSTCTAITQPLNQVTSSTNTGSLCLPTAVAGRLIFLANGTGNGLNLFGSNQSFTVGTQDTINGTAGSTAYTSGPAANKQTVCWAPANGVWFCFGNVS